MMASDISLNAAKSLTTLLPKNVDPKSLYLYETKWVQDFRGNNYLLFTSEWSIRYILEHNEGLELLEYGQRMED